MLVIEDDVKTSLKKRIYEGSGTRYIYRRNVVTAINTAFNDLVQ